jgi:hypothetical protein
LPAFLEIARSAIAHGYQFHWHGFDIIDRTVRWYLAERPDVISITPNLTILSEMIDAFLDAGLRASGQDVAPRGLTPRQGPVCADVDPRMPAYSAGIR